MKAFFKPIIIAIITIQARLVLRKYRPRIVAVVGSVGKTSTKDAIATALGDHLFVRASKKSLNSTLGVPLTILGRESGWSNPLAWLSIIFEGLALILFKNHYPRWLVLEVGMDHPGEIRSIASWLAPDVVVFTRIGAMPVHLEFFDSREDLIDEKASMVEALKTGGTLVLNADDRDVLALQNRVPHATVISYGFSSWATVQATSPTVSYNSKGMPDGLVCEISYRGKTAPLSIYGSISRPMIVSALAAFAVGEALGINMIELVEDLSTTKPTAGRGRLLAGVKGSLLIDDSYNASPAAMEAAFESLAEITTEGRKIAVLGDMLELGENSIQAHKNIGVLASKVADIIVTVGMHAELIGTEAIREGFTPENLRHYHESPAAGVFLASIITEDDIVLVKGSQGIRLERTLEQILAEPEKKAQLLVRQEEAWKYR